MTSPSATRGRFCIQRYRHAHSGPGTPTFTRKCYEIALGSGAFLTKLLTDWEGCAAQSWDVLSTQVCLTKVLKYIPLYFPKPFHVHVYLILFWKPPEDNRANMIIT